MSNDPDNHKIVYKYKVIVSSEYGSDGDITPMIFLQMNLTQNLDLIPREQYRMLHASSRTATDSTRMSQQMDM